MKKLIIKILNKIQDFEVEKPIEKMNTDLIIKCSRLILKLRGEKPLTEEEIKKRVEKMFQSSK